MQEQSRLLVGLSATDATLLDRVTERKAIDERRASELGAIEQLRVASAAIEAQRKDTTQKQDEEQTRLREEERRIVERRKQLMALGGTRAAKLLEREIDIASRTIQGIEQKVMQLLNEVEAIEAKVASMRKDIDDKQLSFEDSLPGMEKRTAELDADIKSLQAARDKTFEALDERVRGLYLRVHARYPGAAVARAASSSCRACYRALPAQTFNQVLAGNALIQCPGCSRILVSAEV